jgi:hypothetical protein
VGLESQVTGHAAVYCQIRRFPFDLAQKSQFALQD